MNVVAFPPPPELASCDLYLDDAFGLELRLRDGAGNVVAVLAYTLDLASKPEGFDLDRLRDAWSVWRGASSVVA